MDQTFFAVAFFGAAVWSIIFFAAIRSKGKVAAAKEQAAQERFELLMRQELEEADQEPSLPTLSLVELLESQRKLRREELLALAANRSEKAKATT